MTPFVLAADAAMISSDTQMRKPGSKKKSCLALLWTDRLPGPQSGTNQIWLKIVVAIFFIFYPLIDALFELRSMLRDPIPVFEKLEMAEGTIRIEPATRSLPFKVMVATPHGLIGGTYPWSPCHGRSGRWASQHEGKQAKIWYFNQRVVQMQIGDHVDDWCEYNNSLKFDKEARETSIRSFTVDAALFPIGILFALWACRQLKSTTNP